MTLFRREITDALTDNIVQKGDHFSSVVWVDVTHVGMKETFIGN
jgi:hypothetical protein